MSTSLRNALATAFAAAALSAMPLGAQIVPTGTFGSQPSITFGGTGIPNHSVMVNSNAGELGLTLALSAAQRYDNPALSNNGAGVFFAGAGTDLNAPSPANPYGLWNFNWHIGGANRGQYTYALFYDLNPASGNSEASHPRFESPLFEILGLWENSWNLGMDFLDGNGPVPPNYDPNIGGEYTFALVAYSGDAEVARSAIQVNVSAVPEPSTYALMAAGLAGIGFAARRRRNA